MPTVPPSRQPSNPPRPGIPDTGDDEGSKRSGTEDLTVAGINLTRFMRRRVEGLHPVPAARLAALRSAHDARQAALDALERLGEPVVVTDGDGQRVLANRAARDLRADLGAQVEGIEPGDVETGAVGADGEPIARQRLPTEATRLSGRPATHAEIGLRSSDGSIRWLRATTRRLDEAGPPFGVVTSYTRVPELRAALAETAALGDARVGADTPDLAGDATTGGNGVHPRHVSLRTVDEAELRQARELFRTSFDKAPIGMALIGTDGRWIQVNQALCDLLGYSEPELMQRTFIDVTHPEDIDAQVALSREVLAGRRAGYQMDKRYVHADGHTIWVAISVSLVTDEDGRPLHLISQVLDVTDRHHMEQRLQHLADHDPLTGVLNRRRFEEELIRQLDRCRRYDEQAVLVMLDLDHFKSINDAHGHAVGDEVLETVAAALLGKVRSSDVLARVGGDEFALILVGVGPEQAPVTTNGLAAVVRDLEGLPLGTTASVGATVLRPTDRADEALFRADEAMYRVKAAGRDGALVDDAAAGPMPS